MPSRIKSFIQYLAIIAAIVFLVWFSLRGLKPAEGQNKWDYLVMTWNRADKLWLWIMALIMMISHLVRAERWRMMLAPAGHKITLGNSFLSIMVGYIVNLAIPRGGEVSRCYNLYKLDKTPVDVSFGTVVVERVVDLVCFCLLIILVFFFESAKILSFLNTLPISADSLNSKFLLILLAGAVAALLFLIFFLIVRKNQKASTFILKTWQGIKTGLLTVFRLKRKGLFIFYSLSIWFLYFLTSYAVMLAFPSTQQLGLNAVLSLFAIGSLAMLIPLPGGTGSYHTIVPACLVFLYQIPQTDAVAFTFVFHGWQTLMVIVAGGISLIVTSLSVKKTDSQLAKKEQTV